MKKIFLLIMVFLASVFAVNANLDVTLDDYDPRPVEPGEKFIVVFDIRNVDKTTETFEFKLDVDAPFFLTTSTLKERTIDPGENEEIKFRVDVDDDATETKGEITFLYRILESEDPWTREEFEIDIDNEVSLRIIEVSTIPEVISKGDRADLTITIENDGDIDVRGIKVDLDLSDIPLAPYSSVGFKEIKKLDSGEKTSVILSIVALDEADSAFYKVPIMLEFEEEDGNDFLQEDIITVRVGSKPSIDVVSESNFLIIGQRNIVDLSVINKGDGDAEFLEAELFADPKYTILSTSKIYLGNVDSDDFEDLTFNIFVNDVDVTLNLRLTYEDDSGEKTTKTFRVPVNAYTRSEAQQLGLVQQNTTIFWVMGAVVVVVLILVIRLIRKRRHKEE